MPMLGPGAGVDPGQTSWWVVLRCCRDGYSRYQVRLTLCSTVPVMRVGGGAKFRYVKGIIVGPFHHSGNQCFSFQRRYRIQVELISPGPACCTFHRDFAVSELRSLLHSASLCFFPGPLSPLLPHLEHTYDRWNRSPPALAPSLWHLWQRRLAGHSHNCVLSVKYCQNDCMR